MEAPLRRSVLQGLVPQEWKLKAKVIIHTNTCKATKHMAYASKRNKRHSWHINNRRPLSQVPEAACDYSYTGNLGQILRPRPRWSLMLLIKDAASWHFMSLPLFIVKFLVPLHSSCSQMQCIFDKMRAYVLWFFKKVQTLLAILWYKAKIEKEMEIIPKK